MILLSITMYFNFLKMISSNLIQAALAIGFLMLAKKWRSRWRGGLFTRKCTGNNTHEWGSDEIFDVSCKHCGEAVEFFKDEIVRYCHACGKTVTNDRKDYGCRQWCSSNSEHTRSFCSKFKRSKSRFYGRLWRKKKIETDRWIEEEMSERQEEP